MDGRGQSEKGNKPTPPPYEEIQPSFHVTKQVQSS